jgi:uncharacterized SAM-binding protein YcdF (DUF218 family)
MTAELPAAIRADVEALWDFNDMHHEVRPSDIGIGLGSHDPNVAIYTAELYHQGVFPLITFTGANAPTTVERFPRGEAVHFREIAIELGVPTEAILIETESRTTAQNVELTRKLLGEHNISVHTATVISRPYQQRRAYGIAKLAWPELDVRCASRLLPLDEYIADIGDMNRVVTMLVGDTQRVALDARYGFAITQDIPDHVRVAHRRLVAAGFTGRVVPDEDL